MEQVESNKKRPKTNEKGECANGKKQKTKGIEESLRVHYYSKLEVIDIIIKTLSPIQMDMFKKGPFGHFLNFEIKKSQVQLLVHLNRKLSNSRSTKNTLIFDFEGQTARFGLKEFCLMTGLYCNPLPKKNEPRKVDPEVGEPSLKDSFFKHRDSIDRRDISSAFRIGRDNDQLMVKLANLYILECFLYCKQQHNKVEWKHLDMIEDTTILNTYPWGRLIFDLTVEYFLKASQMTNFTLQGFPHVFVCWAFEIIPKLSKPPHDVAIQIGQNCPRMMNWKSDCQPEAKLLQNHIFETSDFSIVPLMPTKDELSASYFQYFVHRSAKEIENTLNEESDVPIEEENKRREDLVSIKDDIRGIKQDLTFLKAESQEIKQDLTFLKAESQETKKSVNEMVELLHLVMEVIIPPVIDVEK